MVVFGEWWSNRLELRKHLQRRMHRDDARRTNMEHSRLRVRLALKFRNLLDQPVVL